MATTGVQLPNQNDVLRCSKCKTAIDDEQTNLRIKGKCRAQFVCKVCNCRTVQMYQVGDVKEFKKKLQTFTEEQQTDFWASLGEEGLTKEQLKEKMDHFMEKFHLEQQKDTTGGQYQPLSWYKAQGYDPEVIKAKCKDVLPHEILGDTYRVNIIGSEIQTYAGKKTTDAMSSLANRRPSSSSSGVTSQGEGRQKDAQKEAETAQQQAKEMKQMQTQMKKRKEDASKVMAKLTPEQFLLASMMKSKELKSMPEKVATKIKVSYDKINGAVAECKDIMSNKIHKEPSMDSKAADTFLKTCALQRSLVGELMAQTMIGQMP